MKCFCWPSGKISLKKKNSLFRELQAFVELYCKWNLELIIPRVSKLDASELEK